MEENECNMLVAMCIVADDSCSPIQNQRGQIDCLRSAIPCRRPSLVVESPPPYMFKKQNQVSVGTLSFYSSVQNLSVD